MVSGGLRGEARPDDRPVDGRQRRTPEAQAEGRGGGANPGLKRWGWRWEWCVRARTIPLANLA
jgi:hypothetical protein